MRKDDDGVMTYSTDSSANNNLHVRIIFRFIFKSNKSDSVKLVCLVWFTELHML